MIKRCPSCNRTYSDESISFCLADGALLSAPYTSSKDEAPATEILPPPSRAAVSPTQPAKPAIPTFTRLPEFRGVTLAKRMPRRTESRGVIWVAVVFAVVALVGVGFLLRYAMRDSNESTSAVAQPGPVTVNNTPASSASPRQELRLLRIYRQTRAISADSRQPNSPAASPATDSSKSLRVPKLIRRQEFSQSPSRPTLRKHGIIGSWAQLYFARSSLRTEQLRISTPCLVCRTV